MKNRGFTLIEVVISITIFLLVIIPTMEFNRFILETDKKYSAIEKSIKNIEMLERKIRSKGYKYLSNHLGIEKYKFLEDSYFIKDSGILENIELLFLGKKGEKIIVTIEKLKTKLIIENIDLQDIISLKIEYQTKYKNFEIKRLISEVDEYY